MGVGSAAAAPAEGVVAGEPGAGDAESEDDVGGCAEGAAAPAPWAVGGGGAAPAVDPPLPTESGVVAGVAEPEAGPGSAVSSAAAAATTTAAASSATFTTLL